jgi:hypothetical protein
MRYYRLKNRELNWGDYGDILLTGMTTHLDRQDGLLQLERTGPFQPNIVISGICDLIVTDSFKNKLQNSSFNNLGFKQVIKRHISLVDWTNWNLQANDPQFYPTSGEPEGYILETPHSSDLAEKMENVWEVLLIRNGKFQDDSSFVIGDKTADIMSAENRGWIIVTEIAKNWLEQNEATWLAFEELNKCKE